MTALTRPIVRHWLILAFLASAAMLAIAHAFQTFGGLAPCALCLRQREIYWDALGVSGVGIVLSFLPPAVRLKPLVFAALALVFLAGAATAAYHAGAEWKWWPGPQACSSGGGGASAQSLAALMHGAKVHAPRCDEAAWRMLGLSMAGWNVLASLAFAGFSGAAAAESLRRD
jgi:disulfide bond formation protein DsbB